MIDLGTTTWSGTIPNYILAPKNNFVQLHTVKVTANIHYVSMIVYLQSCLLTSFPSGEVKQES